MRERDQDSRLVRGRDQGGGRPGPGSGGSSRSRGEGGASEVVEDNKEGDDIDQWVPEDDGEADGLRGEAEAEASFALLGGRG